MRRQWRDLESSRALTKPPGSKQAVICWENYSLIKLNDITTKPNKFSELINDLLGDFLKEFQQCIINAIKFVLKFEFSLTHYFEKRKW